MPGVTSAPCTRTFTTRVCSALSSLLLNGGSQSALAVLLGALRFVVLWDTLSLWTSYNLKIAFKDLYPIRHPVSSVSGEKASPGPLFQEKVRSDIRLASLWSLRRDSPVQHPSSCLP